MLEILYHNQYYKSQSKVQTGENTLYFKEANAETQRLKNVLGIALLKVSD